MRIGMVGYQFMGRAHAHAYRTAPYFFPIQSNIELAAVCGRARRVSPPLPSARDGSPITPTGAR